MSRPADDVLLAWQRGEVGANLALSKTREEWARVAKKLWRQYRTRLPAWVGFEDVHQVVLMNIPRLVGRYEDIGPGSSITRFVASQAMLRAEKAVHRWRNARRHGPGPGKRGVNPRCEPSNFEMPVDLHLDRDERGPRWADTIAFSVEATQEGDVASTEEFRRVLAGIEDPRVTIALIAVRRARGDERNAARILWSSSMARLHCDLRTEGGARRLVRIAMAEASALVAA